MERERIAVYYIVYCPIVFDFIDPFEDCPKCPYYEGGDCPFLIDFMMNLEELKRTYKEKGFEVIVVNESDTRFR